MADRAYSASSSARIQRIVSNARRALILNPRNRAVMSSPPTVSVGSTAPTTIGTTAAFLYPQASLATEWDAVVKDYGGWRVLSGNYIYTRAATVDASQPVDRTGVTNSTGVQNLRKFVTDAPIFYVRVQGANITGQNAIVKIIVDGQYSNSAGYTLTVSGSHNYLMVDFSSAGGRALRVIEIESANSNGFGYVYTDTQSTVFPAPEDELPPIIVMTDSYGVGTGATAAVDSVAAQLRHYLGYPNIVVNAIGGTGILARNGASNNALDRAGAGDIAALNPAAVISLLGVNDCSQINSATITRSAFQAQIALYLAAVKTAAPLAAHAVFGPWTPIGSQQTILGQTDDDIAAGVAAFADAKTFNVRTYRRKGINYPTNQGVRPILWGNGNTSSPAGSGPNDIYLTSDTIHPNSGGHGVLASWVAREFVAGLSASFG